MPVDETPQFAPDLEEAVDRHPLIVTPTTSIQSVITQMSRAWGSTCALSDERSPLPTAASTCALVMEGKQLLGIVTERDIVHLTALGGQFLSRTVADVMASPVVTLPKSSFQDIFAALFLFRRHRIRNLPIVDDAGHLLGVVTPSSLRRVLRPVNLLKLRRVAEVMTTPVIHAPLNTSLLSISRRLAEHHVSGLVITEPLDNGGFHPVGIITERDMVQFLTLGINLAQTQAQTVMSSPLFLLSPEDSLWRAHQEMHRRHVRRLVVSWNWGTMLGIVTQTSLLRVFDPIEMYSVIETLQQTLLQNQPVLETPLFSGVNSPVEPTSTPSTRAPACDRVSQIQHHLESVTTRLQSLYQTPQLSPAERQAQLALVLQDLDQVRSAIQSAPFDLNEESLPRSTPPSPKQNEQVSP